MKKYIAVFEVPDGYKPTDYLENADGWFTDEEGNRCTVGTKLEEAKQGEWIDERNDGGACLAICSKCRTLEITGCFCRTCGSNNTDSFMKLFNCGADMRKGDES
jgi:hypothetical protein